MTAWPSVLPVALGAVASLPYLTWVRRSRRPIRLLCIGLVVAAVVYVAFGLVGGAGNGDLLVEGLGVVAFAAIAFAGARLSPLWLGLGWGTHVVWDLALHPVAGGYSPAWYPACCVGFDLIVAGYVLGRFGSGARASGGAHGPDQPRR